MERLSPSVEGNLEGAPLLWILKVMKRKAIEKGISLHRGPVGEPGRGLFTGEFER
jgi:hypothetical protein